MYVHSICMYYKAKINCTNQIIYIISISIKMFLADKQLSHTI